MFYNVIDQGRVLDARVELVGSDVRLHSRSGRRGTPGARNSDYSPGLRSLLRQLRLGGLGLTGAYVDSNDVQSMALPDRQILKADEAGLSPEQQFTLLNQRMRRVGRKDDRPGGNNNKLIRLCTGAAPEALRGLLDLEPAPQAGAVPRRPSVLQGDGEQAVPPASGVFTLSQDLAVCDQAFHRWISGLERQAQAWRQGLKWLSAQRVMFTTRESKKRDGAMDVRLGVRPGGAPWSVEINAPREIADENGLSSVASDAEGRLYVVRQGYLRGNPDSNGDVSAQQFRTLSGLTPLPMVGPGTDAPRDWYLVADLGASDEVIAEQTGRFVDACDQARRLTRPDLPSEAPPPLFAGGEKGGTYVLAAMEAQPEKVVRMLHGEVWLALADRLGANRIELRKPCHPDGYEVDGLVETQAGQVLIEIKTACRAADVYEGLGQILLYGSMMGIKADRRILLMPGHPSPALIAAALSYGIEVHAYDLCKEDGAVTVRFTDDFMAACGGA